MNGSTNGHHSTGIVLLPGQEFHDTGRHPENGQRLPAVLHHLRESSDWDRLSVMLPREAGLEDIARVHSERHIDLIEADDLSGALAPSTARGQLLIAVLGRLSRADAIALTNARRDGRLCRAMILHPATEGEPEDPAELLEAGGWHVVRDPARLAVTDAWAGLAWGAPR